MKFVQTTILSPQQMEAITTLWNEEYPINICHQNVEGFQKYLDGLSDKKHVLVISENDGIVGWYIAFIRNSERWFSMILSKQIQGMGVGTKLLNLAKKENKLLNGWVIDHDRYKTRNGETYHSPVGFYKKNGFHFLSDIRLETDKISAVKIFWKAKL